VIRGGAWCGETPRPILPPALSSINSLNTLPAGWPLFTRPPPRRGQSPNPRPSTCEPRLGLSGNPRTGHARRAPSPPDETDWADLANAKRLVGLADAGLRAVQAALGFPFHPAGPVQLPPGSAGGPSDRHLAVDDGPARLLKEGQVLREALRAAAERALMLHAAALKSVARSKDRRHSLGRGGRASLRGHGAHLAAFRLTSGNFWNQL
jgi:hypothetical protein